mmetsp:Transcript_100650/g.267542  ORF Transcript_100650/g.267542 Transcript_100650/m.267542 type:complete len:202 (+) Transcript_100650:402-1007(+)
MALVNPTQCQAEVHVFFIRNMKTFLTPAVTPAPRSMMNNMYSFSAQQGKRLKWARRYDITAMDVGMMAEYNATTETHCGSTWQSGARSWSIALEVSKARPTLLMRSDVRKRQGMPVRPSEATIALGILLCTRSLKATSTSVSDARLPTKWKSRMNWMMLPCTNWRSDSTKHAAVLTSKLLTAWLIFLRSLPQLRRMTTVKQ